MIDYNKLLEEENKKLDSCDNVAIDSIQNLKNIAQPKLGLIIIIYIIGLL